MPRLEIKRHLGDDDLAAVEALLAIAARADGHSVLDEHRWLDMAHGGRDAHTALVAWEAGHDHPIAYAQVSRGRASGAGTWALDLVIDPHHRYDALDIGPELLRAALGVVADEGGGHVHLWVSQPTAAHDAIASAVGLVRGRDLLQLRRPLPVEEVLPPLSPLRAFVPGSDDEAAWLDVNNRAFDWHPEQGGWTVEDLHAREAEPWFSPEGFLLHHDPESGRLAGFCWTKVHAATDHDPAMGEIYVIAVDPDFAGGGLGRSLVLHGLDHLWRVRGMEHGMLYVDAANEPAVRLYDKLGFHVDHVDRAYVTDIA